MEKLKNSFLRPIFNSRTSLKIFNLYQKWTSLKKLFTRVRNQGYSKNWPNAHVRHKKNVRSLSNLSSHAPNVKSGMLLTCPTAVPDCRGTWNRRAWCTWWTRRIGTTGGPPRSCTAPSSRHAERSAAGWTCPGSRAALVVAAPAASRPRCSWPRPPRPQRTCRTRSWSSWSSWSTSAAGWARLSSPASKPRLAQPRPPTRYRLPRRRPRGPTDRTARRPPPPTWVWCASRDHRPATSYLQTRLIR